LDTYCSNRETNNTAQIEVGYDGRLLEHYWSQEKRVYKDAWREGGIRKIWKW